MLILSRYEGESIYIGDDVQITVFETKDGQVFLGIDAPKNIPVHRAEIYYRNKHRGDATPGHKAGPKVNHMRQQRQPRRNGERNERSNHGHQQVCRDYETTEINGNVRSGNELQEASDGNARSGMKGNKATRINYRTSRRYPRNVAKSNQESMIPKAHVK